MVSGLCVHQWLAHILKIYHWNESESMAQNSPFFAMFLNLTQMCFLCQDYVENCTKYMEKDKIISYLTISLNCKKQSTFKKMSPWSKTYNKEG